MAAQFEEMREVQDTWPGLASLTQSVFAGLGTRGFRNPFRLERSTATCLLLIDGLGWDLLKAHAVHAPFLASLMQPDGHFKVGFPATTAASLAAVTSGLGYALWYSALRGLSPQVAGSSQLSVPVITALAGVLLLGETIDLRLALGAAAVLGGIALTRDWRRA